MWSHRAGCKDNEKDKFWMDLGDFVSTIPKHKSMLIGADVNGHIGQKRDGAGDYHDNYVYEIYKEGGEESLNLQ